MSVTIVLDKSETHRVWCAAQLNVNRHIQIGDTMPKKSMYRREENRILNCIARKHNADYIQLQAEFPW